MLTSHLSGAEAAPLSRGESEDSILGHRELVNHCLSEIFLLQHINISASSEQFETVFVDSSDHFDGVSRH